MIQSVLIHIAHPHLLVPHATFRLLRYYQKHAGSLAPYTIKFEEVTLCQPVL